MRCLPLVLALSAAALSAAPAHAQIDLPRPPAERPAPERGTPPANDPQPSAPRATMTCTVCGEASQPVPESLPTNGLPPKAFCKVCRAERFHKLPKGARAGSRSGSGGSGGLDLPTGSGAPAPATEPAGAETQDATPGAPVRNAAGIVLAEVAKRRRLEDPLLDQAVESLTGMGAAGLEAAREALGSDQATVVLVAARVLVAGAQGEDRSRVARRIEAGTPGTVGGLLVRELAEADPVLASPAWLAGLVAHRQNVVRAAAHRLLGEEPRAEWIPLLAGALGARSADARFRAVDLVASTGAAEAIPVLMEHLADPRSKVAARVVDFLARHPDPSIEPLLLEKAFGERWILRPAAFALLALVEREDARLLPILGPGHVEALVKGSSSQDPFVAASCALALAGVGFRSTDPLSTSWLDTTVPTLLMDVLAGRQYFEEREALTGAVVRRLQLITGQSLGPTARLWADWWAENARDFRATRAVMRALPTDAPELAVELFDRARGQRFVLLGPAWLERARPDGGAEPFYLAPTAATDLMERLRDAGVFGAELLPGVRGGASERARGVEVVLGRQVKGFTFSPGSEPAWFGPLFAAGDSLRERARWQRFAHPVDHGTRRALVAARGADFEGAVDASARARLVADLVLAWMRPLDYGERELGIAELERPEVKATLSITDVVELTALVRDEPYYGPRCRRLVALVEHASGIAPGLESASVQADLREELIDLLHDRYGVDAVDALARLLATGGAARERRAAAGSRPLLRAVAATPLARRASDEDVALLEALLDDDVDLVEIAALGAVGEARLKALGDEVLVRAALDSPAVRSAALRAVGRLGGDDAREVLLTSLTDSSGLYRAPAAEGLVELEDPSVAEIFLSMIRSNREPVLVDLAREGLLRLGEAAHGTLRSALSSPSPGARRAAAQVLARQLVPEAFPPLLRAWEASPENLTLRDELVILTCRELADNEQPVTDWWRWWDGVRQDDALSWFRAACEARTLPTPPNEAFAAGARDPEAIRFLLTVLARPEGFLAERARRELERVLGGPLDPLPQKSEQRALWIQTLNEQLLLREE